MSKERKQVRGFDDDVSYATWLLTSRRVEAEAQRQNNPEYQPLYIDYTADFCRIFGGDR